MHRFEYPGGKPFFVTKETVEKTPYTFHETDGVWEPTSIQYFYNLVEMKHNNKNAVIVDVGAQSGLYSLYAKYLPECKFLAFEPFEETYSYLLDNLELNKICNVKAYNYACGIKNETKVLHVPDHLGLNTLGDTPKRFDTWKDVTIQVIKLDDILSTEHSFDYLKCDTEGWEYNVLKGAEESIRCYKPELFFEINDENLEQCHVKKEDLLDFVHSLDYRLVLCIDNENFHFTSA
jgi:FkbM family methyltransferase